MTLEEAIKTLSKLEAAVYTASAHEEYPSKRWTEARNALTRARSVLQQLPEDLEEELRAVWKIMERTSA